MFTQPAGTQQPYNTCLQQHKHSAKQTIIKAHLRGEVRWALKTSDRDVAAWYKNAVNLVNTLVSNNRGQNTRAKT